MKYLITVIALCALQPSFAQLKKPLTHDVYDGWKSVGERVISNNGRFAVYTIVPQEGDGTLFIHDRQSGTSLSAPRGYSPVISADSKFIFFKIKPPFQDTRRAKIKKKKPDEMPKDSLAMVTVGSDSIIKIPLVKSFRVPEKGNDWLAYLAEKPIGDSMRKKAMPDSVRKKIDVLVKIADSLIRASLDSVKGNISQKAVREAAQKAVIKIYRLADNAGDESLDADGDDAAVLPGTEGTDLTLQNLLTGDKKIFRRVNEYFFNKNGTRLLIECAKYGKDSSGAAVVILYDLKANKADTIMKRFNDAKRFVFDEAGNRLAFVAERDSTLKALQKFHKLWYWRQGLDSAIMLADQNTAGLVKGFTVSENGELKFSKDGEKLFFGAAPIMPPKDTNLVDFEMARLDVWHYNDDYLQPQQLKQLPAELKRSYTAVAFPAENKILQLGTDSSENISLINEGNANVLLAQSTKGNRISSQWEGRTLPTAYLINVRDGSAKLISRKGLGAFNASPAGKYIYWYDPVKQHYFTCNTATGIIKNISEKIKLPLYDTENDVPDLPASAGTSGWLANDDALLINDEFDIWKVDPDGSAPPVNITNGYGRKNNINFDYVRTDTAQRFFRADERIILRSLNKTNKQAGYWQVRLNERADPKLFFAGPVSLPGLVKARDTSAFLFLKADVSTSDLYASGEDLQAAQKLTDLASQHNEYNWLTAELVRWKMFDGKMSEGILYKPENFDPAKKYPVIFYFYERNANTLYNYRAPAPSASTINIPLFVSNGYLVFDPNIYYKTGEPGESAYNSVVSAAKYLSKMPWVDSTRMGIQGQSWGGYQVAYLVTRTSIFRAAGAGAPVSNMTSAYGGIRWGPGINRQFQYEKQQSRIGATLWQRPDLYIKNSPLFAANKITTPLLIMHNDADGSVPWYQGIELFTAMKRLGKKVWMLEYNGEDHNLVERRNRKDLSVRLSQFFDYWLKDAKPADWIKYGVPATQKGINYGLSVQE